MTVVGIFHIYFVGLRKNSKTRSLQFLDLETWWQRLLQLVSLFLVLNDQSVQESGASNLKLDVVWVLLDLDALGVLPPGLQQEIL